MNLHNWMESPKAVEKKAKKLINHIELMLRINADTVLSVNRSFSYSSNFFIKKSMVAITIVILAFPALSKSLANSLIIGLYLIELKADINNDFRNLVPSVFDILAVLVQKFLIDVVWD